eukprot:PhM_4_TR18424/c3_g1_i1/m.85255
MQGRRDRVDSVEPEQGTGCRFSARDSLMTRQAGDPCIAKGRVQQLPHWDWTEEELTILLQADTELPTVTPTPYYPSGTTLWKAGRKVREARQRTNAPLAAVSSQRLSYDAIRNLSRGDLEAWEGEIAWITTDRIVQYIPETRPQPKISRYLGDDAARLKEWGLVQPGRGLTSSHVFKVPKAENSRLIVDCRDLNELLPPPTKMPLPNLHRLLDEILTASFLAQLDAKSYFYQFPLEGEARQVFGVALGDRRGPFEHGLLTVMPMGFKYAPSIAQLTSMLLLENVPGPSRASAWIDNFLFWGEETEVQQSVQSFRAVCGQVGLELKEDYDEGTQCDLLGMSVDLCARTISLGDNNRNNIIEAWETLQKLPNARNVYKVFGMALWALYAVARTPLCMFDDVIAEAGSLAPDSRWGWDDEIDLDTMNKQRWQDMVSAALHAHWHPAHPRQDDLMICWSDASMEALGWVFEDSQASWARWQTEGEHIFLRELLAAVWGAKAVRETGHIPLLLIDNTAALRAIQKGYAHSRKANVLLRRLHSWGPAWSGWVPTNAQRADAPSRGLAPTSSTEALQVRVSWPRWA